MDSVDGMAITVPEFLRLIVRDYPFTLALGAVILLVSMPFNVLLPPSQYCGNWPPAAAAFLHLTSPFNIGCEASLMDLWTDIGAARFVGNFTFVMVFSCMVEYALNPLGRRLKRNIYVAAVMAAYFLELTTVGFFKSMSVGTSIIGVSLMITLTCWLLYKGWMLRKKPLVSWIPLAGALFLAWVAFTVYSAENAFGHAVGSVYFLLFMAMFLKEPDWWERWVAAARKAAGRAASL